MSDSQTLKLSVDASGFKAGADEVKRSTDKIVDATRGAEAATIKLIESQGRQQRSVDALSRRLDPLGQAVRDASRDLERLTRISQGSGEAADRASRLMASAQARVTAAQHAQTASTKTAENAQRSFTAQTTETTGALQRMASQQSGIIGAAATGGAFAVGMLAAAKAVELLGAALKAIPAAGDAANASIARLSATVGSSEQGASIFEALTASSRQTGIAVTDSASAFQRFSIAAKDLGATNDQVLKLVDGLQKFAIVSGSPMQETAAATQQIAQALASGVLQGDELRSIIENMPMFAQALAKELGVSMGSLRAMGAEGKLTAEVVFPAMQRAAQGIDDVFAGMPITMARAQAQFDVAAQSFLTHLDRAIGFSNRLADALRVAASIVDKIRNFTGGSTGAERTAELIAGQTGIQKRIEEWKLALADARASQLPDSDQQVQAILKGMDAAKSELEKNRAELLRINNEFVLKEEAEQAKSSENRLAAEVVSHGKSVDELRKKFDKDFTIRKEYDENVKKLEAARNSGSVSEADYLKISTAMLKERDEALAKLTKTEETHKTGVKATTKAVEEQVSAYQKGMDSLNKTIEETNQATEAQGRITAAYDGTQASLDRVQAQEKAHATALKSGIVPEMQEYEATVSRLSESYLRSTDAAREFQHIQSSVSAVLDTIGNAADRLGQGLVDAFLSGRGAAVNFGNIAKAAVSSVVSDLIKLGAVNPLRNSLLGTASAPTLSAGLGALTGGDGGGGLSSIFGGLSNASTLTGITDAFGLTNISGQLSSFGEHLGLTGSNGLLGGVGGGINSILGTSLWSGPTGSLATTAGAEFGGAAGLAAGSPVTLGSLIGGVGLGFGAGSLAGGFLQSSLGKVGPAPTIGAGGGALAGAAIGSIVPGIGTLIGGLLGGLLGGAGGGLIGPKAATPFSATGLNKDGNGMLSVGQTFSQIVDVTAEVNALQQQVSALNALLSGSGTRIANAVSADNYGQARLIGGNSGQWLNFGQGDGRPGDLNAAFGELRFGSDNQYLNRGLEGQSFGTAEALQTAVSDILNFVNATAPALKALVDDTPSFGAGTLATTIDTLSRQFDDAKVMADRLGFAEYDLTEARAKAIQIANDNAAKQLEDSRQGLLARFTAARGVNSGNLQMQLDAQLLVFDAQAATQREAFGNNLKTVFGDAYAETQAFADQMAFLEATLGEERLSTAKSYLDQINAAQAQASAQAAQAAAQAAAQTERATSTATGIVRNITDYVRGIKFGAESPLSSGERYMAASEQFNRTINAARSGDGAALSSITSVAETFRSASRAQYGSGAQSVRDFERIVSALEGVATMPAETLTGAIFTNETRTQTQTLVMELRDLKAELSRLRDDVRRAGTAPPSTRAA